MPEAVGECRALDPRVLEHVRIKAWERLLFVECGDGWLVEEAWRRSAKGCVYGLSMSPQLVELATRLRGVTGQVEFRTWDGRRFPHTNQSCDCVISCVPCGSYPQPMTVLREMARVLRPGGEAYLLESEHAASAVNLERLLVETGFAAVRWTDLNTAANGPADGTPLVIIQVRQSPDGT